MSRRGPTARADRDLVISSRPASPAGHSPVRSTLSGTSSRTTSQGSWVSPSQLTKRTATELAVPVGSRPVAATDACTNPDMTAARLVAESQISPSMARDRHKDSAIITAIWVLPHAPGQFGRVWTTAGSGTSATAEPGTRTSARPPTVSGRSVKPSVSGGISPTRNRRVGSAGIPTGPHRPPTPIDTALQRASSEHLITREGSSPGELCPYRHLSRHSDSAGAQADRLAPRVRRRPRCSSGSGGRLLAADRRRAGPARSARGRP